MSMSRDAKQNRKWRSIHVCVASPYYGTTSQGCTRQHYPFRCQGTALFDLHIVQIPVTRAVCAASKPLAWLRLSTYFRSVYFPYSTLSGIAWFALVYSGKSTSDQPANIGRSRERFRLGCALSLKRLHCSNVSDWFKGNPMISNFR